MNTSKTILLSAAWLVSLLIAFVIGSGLESQSQPSTVSAPEGSPLAGGKEVAVSSGSSDPPPAHASDPLSEERRAEQVRDELRVALAGPQNTPRAQDEIENLLKELARTNPVEALELVGQIKSMRAREDARSEILETWAAYDPVAALAWAEVSLAGATNTVRNSQLLAIYRGYAILNPQAALQAAGQLSDATRADRRLKTRVMEEVIETQIENGDLVAARQSIELMDEGDLKTNLMREMVDEWASFDPEGAAAYVDSLGPEAESRLKIALVDEWAVIDPAAAAAWLGKLDEGDPTLSRAATELIREWARYDLTASAEWLNSLPATPELDRAVASYTFRAVQEDPASAMGWAESVTNERMQSYLKQRVAGAWREDDPDGFQAYLDQSELSEEEKDRLKNSNAWGGGRGAGGGRGRN